MNDDKNTFEYHVQDNSDVEGSVMAAVQKHYAKRDYGEALKLLLGISNTNASADLYINIGNCYFKLERNNEAFEYWSKAIDLDPKNAAAYSNMGNLYYKTGQTEKAISFWLAALVSRPEDAATSLNLAIAYNSKSMKLESIKYFERYLKYAEDKDSADYNQVKNSISSNYYMANEYLNHGMNLHDQNDSNKAKACYLKAIESYPTLIQAHVNIGSIYYAEHDMESAIKHWKIASHLDPKQAKSFSNLAIAHDMMKQFDYAYCYYYLYMNYVVNDREEYYKANRRLLKLKPYINENSYLIEPHLEKANEYLSRNRIYDAIDEFKNYTILSPENQDGNKELIKKLESYLNPELDIIKTCLEKGNSLFNVGKFSEAKMYFYRVMLLSSPEYSEYAKARSKFSQCERTEKDIY